MPRELLRSNYKPELEAKKAERKELILVSLFGVAVLAYFGAHFVVYLVRHVF